MKRIRSYYLFPLLALVLLIVTFSSSMFGISPLGKLLDPFIGAVQNSGDRRLEEPSLALNSPELKQPVTIYFDSRKVPHVYASNAHDLYFAQGYVSAYLRLWQMDFLSYLAAGRLSEVMAGDQFLDYDRNQRRIGVAAAAQRSLELMDQNPETREALDAYTAGVNAYIGELDYRSLPVEYKMLDYRPEPWSRLKSAMILKNMANLLSGYGEDVSMSRLYLALGSEEFRKLYPEFHRYMAPLMEDGPPASGALAQGPEFQSGYLDYSFMNANPVVMNEPYNPRLGSNSWAVSGKRTRSGSPLLASDPHLNLSLPGVWLEMQLSAPGMNVYGVSIPGTPAVLIGFNRNIAWGLTNGADDVKDWYKLKITEDYGKYELDGQWRKLDRRVEEIRRKGMPPILDTIYSSLHGPIVNDRSYNSNPVLVNYALRWELHQPSNEFLTFLHLGRAANYDQFREALSHYACPVQNFTFISKDNSIAINHQGRIGVKWPGQGKFLLDGSTLR